MSDAPQLLIPLAASTSPGCQHVLKDLALPHLDALLAQLQPAGGDRGEETDFSTPHERALARAMGLDGSHDGTTPWAALEQPAGSDAWAWVTPCQWLVSSDHVTMMDPQALQLTEASSRALLAILAPWFAEDGIELRYEQPTRWLARGPAFAGMATASLDRVMLRDVRAWMPRSSNTESLRILHRLQSEMQMLLYTHPFNDTRAEDNLPPVNSFWVHGAGQLLQQAARPATLQMPQALRETGLREDWRPWAEAWRALDAGAVAQLARHVAAGGEASLTLCGENSSLRFETGAQRGFAQRIKRLFSKPVRFQDIQQQL